MKKKILVTGSSGFIGKNLDESLRSRFNIIPVHRKDIMNKNHSIFNDIYAVIHCGGLAHTKDKELTNFYKANFLYTKKLINLCVKTNMKHFIFLSTINIDFSTKNNLIDKKNFPYAYTKKKTEDLLLNLKNKKFKLYILRLPLVYGHGVKGNLKSLINIVKKNVPLPFKQIQSRKTILSISNLISFIVLILESKIKKKLIYISDKETKSVHQIIKQLIKFNKEKNIFFYLPNYLLKSIFFIFLKKNTFKTLTKDTSEILKKTYSSNFWKPKGFCALDMKKAYESSLESRKII